MSEKYKITNANGMYFFTMTVVDWVDVFTRKRYSDTIIDSITHCQRERGLVVHAYVIMPDHLHLTARGYRLWADAMEPTLWRLLDEPRGKD